MKDFLLEIFTEELPHGSLDPGHGECSQIPKAFEKRFAAENITFTDKDFFLTPRRIAILFRGMEETLPAYDKITNGPPLSICFQGGKPSPTLTGFVKGFSESDGEAPQFSSVEKIPNWNDQGDTKKQSPGFYSRKIGKTDFLIHHQFHPGRKVSDLLQTLIPEVLAKITFTKSMYWGEKQGPFLRPIRSLTALWGGAVIPFSFLGVASGNSTRGHRFLSSNALVIPEAGAYQEILHREKVIVDPQERLDIVIKGVEAIEKKKKVRVVDKSKVASLVSRLTEYPVPVYAEVEPHLIEIPREVVVSEMVEHQIYFPLEDNEGTLIPGFIFTANCDPGPEIIAGNRNVLSSRLSDGIFLFQEDIKVGIEKLSQKTEKILFEKTLGSYADKCKRIAQLAQILQDHSDFFPKHNSDTVTALSRLIKCDLGSGMVNEFPHLQGIMGRYYVEQSSPPTFDGVELNQEIADMVWEHYLPLSTRGNLPASSLGILMSLADKIDNLLGLFVVKLLPSGNHDPYALRRQGYGLLRILNENQIDLPLATILEQGAKLYSDFQDDDGSWVKEVIGFLESRFKTYAKDCGFSPDEVEAVSTSDFNPYRRHLKIAAIQSERSKPSFRALLAAYKRILNITEKNKSSDESIYNTIDLQEIKKHLKQEAETNLLDIHLEIKDRTPSLSRSFQYHDLLTIYYHYPPILETFFEQVMVNVEDSKLRQVRTDLLRTIKIEISTFFDLIKIQIADN